MLSLILEIPVCILDIIIASYYVIIVQWCNIIVTQTPAATSKFVGSQTASISELGLQLFINNQSIAKHKETDGPVCVCVVGRNSGKLNGLGSLERVFLFQDWCAYSGYTHYTAYSSSIPRPTVSGNGITIDYHGPIPRPKVSENRTTGVLFLDPPLVVWPKR